MVWFWRLLKGYLIIEISGENCEKLLNLMSANSLKIWNLFYKNGCIYANISLDSFIKLYSIRKGLKCNIKIIKKHGLYFKIKSHKNRIGFCLGCLIFFIILFFLNNFVWIINVEGNNYIPTNEIISSCKKIGIYEGMNKHKLKNKYDAHKLQLSNSKVAWCSLNLEGCVLTVNLTEVKTSDKQERKNPSNIKSNMDGKIIKINVSSGNTLVKIGDYVSKRDLLVSGVIERMNSTLFVHSSGEIIAETKRVFSASGNFEQTISEKTDEIIKRFSCDVFNIKIPFYLNNVKSPYTYQCEIKNLHLFGKKIPIKFCKEIYTKTKNTKIIYTQEELEEVLYNEIEQQIKEFNFIKYTVCYKDVITSEKGVLLNVTITCEENIAKQENINIK